MTAKDTFGVEGFLEEALQRKAEEREALRRAIAASPAESYQPEAPPRENRRPIERSGRGNARFTQKFAPVESILTVRKARIRAALLRPATTPASLPHRLHLWDNIPQVVKPLIPTMGHLMITQGRGQSVSSYQITAASYYEALLAMVTQEAKLGPPRFTAWIPPTFVPRPRPARTEPTEALSPAPRIPEPPRELLNPTMITDEAVVQAAALSVLVSKREFLDSRASNAFRARKIAIYLLRVYAGRKWAQIAKLLEDSERNVTHQLRYLELKWGPKEAAVLARICKALAIPVPLLGTRQPRVTWEAYRAEVLKAIADGTASTMPSGPRVEPKPKRVIKVKLAPKAKPQRKARPKPKPFVWNDAIQDVRYKLGCAVDAAISAMERDGFANEKLWRRRIDTLLALYDLVDRIGGKKGGKRASLTPNWLVAVRRFSRVVDQVVTALEKQECACKARSEPTHELARRLDVLDDLAKAASKLAA